MAHVGTTRNRTVASLKSRSRPTSFPKLHSLLGSSAHPHVLSLDSCSGSISPTSETAPQSMLSFPPHCKFGLWPMKCGILSRFSSENTLCPLVVSDTSQHGRHDPLTSVPPPPDLSLRVLRSRRTFKSSGTPTMLFLCVTQDLPCRCH